MRKNARERVKKRKEILVATRKNAEWQENITVCATVFAVLRNFNFRFIYEIARARRLSVSSARGK